MAAATTLIIEYAAKPWSELRKDAILEQHRPARQLKATLYRAEYLRGRLEVMREPDYPTPWLVKDWHAEYVLTTSQLRDQGGLLDLRRVLDDLMLMASAHSWGFAQMMDRDYPEEAIQAADADLDKTMELLRDLLHTPRYRLLKRRALLRRAKAVTQEPPETRSEI